MTEHALDRIPRLAQYADGVIELEEAIAGLADDDLDLAESETAWTIRQIVHHVVDGDDLWKSCIKAALGNSKGVFTLQWYWDVPQDEWVEQWDYAGRAIEPSLARFRVNRHHVVELLRRIPDAWDRSIRIRWPQGEDRVTVGEVVVMQARHVQDHVAEIGRVRQAHGLGEK